MSDFAILAPVPLEHLESGQGIATDKGFVAFGSRKFELFRDIDERRGVDPVPVLIYPSHEDDPAKGGCAPVQPLPCAGAQCPLT